MNRNHVTNLRAERSQAHADAVKFLKDGLTSENRAAYNRAMDKVESLAREIQAAEKGAYVPVTATEERESKAAFAVAFDRYMRGGLDNCSQEQRSLLNQRRDGEKRDQTAGTQTVTQSTGSAGGFLVPVDFANEIEVATKFFAPLMDVCKVFTTDSGSTLPYPTADDTGNVATLVGEASGVTEQGFTFGTVNFGAFKYNSRVVKITSELLQDSAFDLYAFVAERFGERFGRAYENVFTNGAGGGTEPKGILTAIAGSGAVPTIAAGSNANDGLGGTGANSIGSQDLVNLEFAVDRSYRRNARYMLHDNTLGKLKNLLDKYGRPLWQPGIAVGAPDTLSGYQYVINNGMPTLSPSAVTVAFGDFSKFLIRKVNNLSIKRLVEVYAVSDDAIAFVGFQRVDSNLIDAGQHPIKVLQQHS